MLCVVDSSGTEPWHFYFVNGMLNFNLVFGLALFSLPLTALMETLLHRFNGEDCVLALKFYCFKYVVTVIFGGGGGSASAINLCVKCRSNDAFRYFVFIVLVLSYLHLSAQLQQVILGNRSNADMIQ